MSDLISRSELYDQLANKLTWLMGYGDDLYLAVGSDIRDVIYNMSTAYDIDKVVEELNQRKIKLLSYAEDYEKTGDFEQSEIYSQLAIEYTTAIEIVKQGGVSEDVCEWKSASDGEFIQNPHTKRLYSNEPSVKNIYCNTCGNKIKIVGD